MPNHLCLRFGTAWLAAAFLASSTLPAAAQLYASPAQPVDQVHYYPATGLSGLIGREVDGQQRQDERIAFTRLAAIGDCVVSHDLPASAAYVRPSLSPGGEARAFGALRDARRCALSSRADHFWLGKPAIRRSAIADALRTRLAR